MKHPDERYYYKINGDTFGFFTPQNVHADNILLPSDEPFKTYWANCLNTQYQRDREAEYPAITDQLDEIYHNGIDSWKAVIKVTKDKYPKG